MLFSPNTLWSNPSEFSVQGVKSPTLQELNIQSSGATRIMAGFRSERHTTWESGDRFPWHSQSSRYRHRPTRDSPLPVGGRMSITDHVTRDA